MSRKNLREMTDDELAKELSQWRVGCTDYNLAQMEVARRSEERSVSMQKKHFRISVGVAFLSAVIGGIVGALVTFFLCK